MDFKIGNLEKRKFWSQESISLVKNLLGNIIKSSIQFYQPKNNDDFNR